MLYFGFFGLEFENNIVIFKIGSSKFSKTNLLTHTVNFGKGSAFSKCLRSAFTQCLVPAPCEIYKVYPCEAHIFIVSTMEVIATMILPTPICPLKNSPFFGSLHHPKILFALQNKKKDIVCKTTKMNKLYL